MRSRNSLIVIAAFPVIAACPACSHGPPIPAAGTATLVGPQAFAVGSALMGPSLKGGCGGQGVDLGPSRVSIILTSQGLPSLLCADAGLPDAGTGYWIDIEMASNFPGTYAIGGTNPGACELPFSSAFLQILTPSGYDAPSIASSGTVTLDSLGAGSIIGSFSALMGPNGQMSTASQRPLSGTFNAIACP